ncbi:MAG: sigma-70 family RNA polymerase sigma factor, partial [Bacteroidota bacterium]
IFIRVYLNAHQFQKNSKFSTWLYAIAHNYCMDVLRKKKKQDLHLCDDMSMASDVAVEQNDPSQMEAQKAALKAIMRKLPPKDRQILTMRFQENMSIEEIARVMKKSEGAVKMKISRAKAKAKALRTRIN